MGLKGVVNVFDNELKKDQAEADELTNNVGMLVKGMVGWLTVVTLATVVVFVVIYKRLGRSGEEPSSSIKLPPDVESTFGDQSSYIRSSIINFHHIPSQLSKASSVASVHSNTPHQARDSSSSGSSSRSESPSSEHA